MLNLAIHIHMHICYVFVRPDIENNKARQHKDPADLWSAGGALLLQVAPGRSAGSLPKPKFSFRYAPLQSRAHP